MSSLLRGLCMAGTDFIDADHKGAAIEGFRFGARVRLCLEPECRAPINGWSVPASPAGARTTRGPLGAAETHSFHRRQLHEASYLDCILNR